jgi:hypothetical protein
MSEVEMTCSRRATASGAAGGAWQHVAHHDMRRRQAISMIDMQVRSENGDVVTHGSHGIRWSQGLGQLDPERYPCLSSLLPYADAVFNERQVERLRRELSDQYIRGLIGEGAAVEAERLCKDVENGSHLYLWFVGD